jgi:hypothetical protein
VNWCYVHPDKANVVVINTFVARYEYASHPDSHHFQAITAEDRRHGSRLFIRTGRCGTIKAALGMLVQVTGSMVEEVLGRKAVGPLYVKTLV